MYSVSDLAKTPNPLAAHYKHSSVDARILLTGHRHQASPDCSLKGQTEAWMAAASHVEARWDSALEKQEVVRKGFAGLLDAAENNIALDTDSHSLLFRFLRALPLQSRPRIITTNGENPSTLRQLYRLMEDGVEVVTVDCNPASTVVERIQAELDEKTAAVCVSSVFHETGHVALELDTLMPVCASKGVELFVDAYQSINALSFSIKDYNLEAAFVCGGGTRYCQMGDGIAFMHIPEGCALRPQFTSRYNVMPGQDPAALPLQYGDGHRRFNGATYDPTAHYRAVYVFDFFQEQGLNPDFLHDVNHRQLSFLAKAFRDADFDPAVISMPVDVEYMGGFIAFQSPYTRELKHILRDVGVHTDSGDYWLRMGPAPYVCDEQLADSMLALEEAVQRLGVR